jgi:integrase
MTRDIIATLGAGPSADVRLLTSSADLLRNGQPLPGLPLFASRDEVADAIGNAWVVWGATSAEYSPNTSWAYARSLQSFRVSMAKAAPGMPWFLASESDVVRYKAEMAGRTKDARRSTNDADGIALKLNGINSAFRFAAEKGLIPARPFCLARKGRERSDAQGCPSISVPNSTTKRPRVITAQQLFRIRAKFHLVDEDARQAMDGLTMFAWATGVREMEAVGFCRNKLALAVLEKAQDANGISPESSLRDVFAATTAEAFVLELWPEWTKGRYGGTIMVPRDIIKRAVDWIELRPSLGVGHFEPVYASARGGNFEPQTIGSYFRMAARAAGIKANFHAIRHSYATRVIEICNAADQGKMGELFVQTQLRHRWRETTMRYKHAAEMKDHGNAAFLAVNTHYQEAI